MQPVLRHDLSDKKVFQNEKTLTMIDVIGAYSGQVHIELYRVYIDIIHIDILPNLSLSAGANARRKGIPTARA